MKVLAPYAYFSPERAASSYLWKNIHQALALADVESVIYVPTPTRGVTSEERDVYKHHKKIETKYQGRLVIYRFPLYREGTNPVLRAIRYFLSCVIQFFLCLFGKNARNSGILFVVSTPPILGYMGVLVKKMRRIPLVYDLQDIFPDSLVGTGLASKGGLLWKIGRVIEDFTYRNADKIIVISEDFKRNIMAKGVPEEKIEVIYNWVDEEAVVDVLRAENKLFDKYGLDRDKFYVTYNGNIGLTQNMDMLLEVARGLLPYEDVHFVLVGEGAYKEQVERIIKDQNLTNVTLLPFQPYEDISHVFSLGDVSLVISKPGVGANSVPSKTWSIMSASRPVLANFDENELKTIIERHDCGIFTKAGDKEAFKEAILTLYGDRNLCERYGRNGRQFIMKNLTKEIGTRKYVNVIKSFEKV